MWKNSYSFKLKAILGIFILLGSVSAGVALVGQNQDIRSHASCMNRCTAEADECEAICNRQDGADSVEERGQNSNEQSGNRNSDSAPGENFPKSYKKNNTCEGRCLSNQECVQFNTSVFYYCKTKIATSYVPPPVVTPVSTATAIPITREIAVNSYNFTPNTVGYDCSRGGCAAGSNAVSGFYETTEGSGIYRAIGGTGNVPYYEEEVKRAIQVAQDQQERDEIAYEQYRLDRLAEEDARIIREQNEARVEQVRLDRIAAEEEIAKNDALEQMRLDRAAAEAEIAKTQQISPVPSSNFFSNLADTISSKFDNAVSNSDLDGIGTYGLGGGNDPVDTYTAETVINAYSSPIVYGNCETSFCNMALTLTQNNINQYTFGKFNPYVENWQRNTQETYDPNQYGFVNYLRSYDAGIHDEQTRNATIDLGVTIAQEFGVVYALPQIATAVASKSIVAIGGTTFQVLGGISTSSQTINAVNVCVNNGLSDAQCKQDLARTTISWLSIGSGQAVNSSATFFNKTANLILSAGNLVIDAGDTLDSCTKFGSNSSGAGCAMSMVALVADIGGGVGDYYSGQLIGPKSFATEILNTPKGELGFGLGNIEDFSLKNLDSLGATDLDIAMNSGVTTPHAPVIADVIDTSNSPRVGLNPDGIMDAQIPTTSYAVRARETFDTLAEDTRSFVNDMTNGGVDRVESFLFGDPLPRTLDTATATHNLSGDLAGTEIKVIGNTIEVKPNLDPDEYYVDTSSIIYAGDKKYAYVNINGNIEIVPLTQESSTIKTWWQNITGQTNTVNTRARETVINQMVTNNPIGDRYISVTQALLEQGYDPRSINHNLIADINNDVREIEIAAKRPELPIKLDAGNADPDVPDTGADLTRLPDSPPRPNTNPSQPTSTTTLAGNLMEGIQNAINNTVNPFASLNLPAPIRNAWNYVADAATRQFNRLFDIAPNLSRLSQNEVQGPRADTHTNPEVNTAIYSGPKIDLIQKSASGTLTPQDLDDVLKSAEQGGINITRNGTQVEVLLGEDGSYSINLPADASEIDKIHELIHLQQDVEALAAGIRFNELRDLPAYNRALFEIQASRETLRYMDSHNIDDDFARWVENTNISESENILEELGEIVPDRIVNAWNTKPQNGDVAHLTSKMPDAKAPVAEAKPDAPEAEPIQPANTPASPLAATWRDYVVRPANAVANFVNNIFAKTYRIDGDILNGAVTRTGLDGSVTINAHLADNSEFVRVIAGQPIPGLPNTNVLDIDGNLYVYRSAEGIGPDGRVNPENIGVTPLTKTATKDNNNGFQDAIDEFVASGTEGNFENYARYLIKNGYEPEYINYELLSKFSERAYLSKNPDLVGVKYDSKSSGNDATQQELNTGNQNITHPDMPISKDDTVTKFKLLADNQKLDTYKNLRGYYMQSDTLAVADGLAHSTIARKFNLDQLKDRYVAYIAEELDYILIDIYHRFDIDIDGPKITSALIQGGVSPNRKIKLKGLYGGLGQGEYISTLEDISKGLDPNKFVWGNTNQNQASKEFTLSTGEILDISNGYKFNTENGTIMVSSVDYGSESVNFKFENGGQQKLNFDEFQNFISKPEIIVLSIPNYTKVTSTKIDSTITNIRELQLKENGISGILDNRGVMHVAETLNHKSIKDSANILDSEVVGDFRFTPDNKTWIISGSPESITAILNQLTNSNVSKANKVVITVTLQDKMFTFEGRMNTALRQLDVETRMNQNNTTSKNIQPEEVVQHVVDLPPYQPSKIAAVRDQIKIIGTQTWNSVTKTWGDFLTGITTNAVARFGVQVDPKVVDVPTTKLNPGSPSQPDFSTRVAEVRNKIKILWTEKIADPILNWKPNSQLKILELTKKDFLPIENFMDELTPNEIKAIREIQSQGIDVYIIPTGKLNKNTSKLIDAHADVPNKLVLGQAGLPDHKSIVLATSMFDDSPLRSQFIPVLEHEFTHLNGTQEPIVNPFKIDLNTVINENIANDMAYIYMVENKLPSNAISIQYESSKPDYQYLLDTINDRLSIKTFKQYIYDVSIGRVVEVGSQIKITATDAYNAVKSLDWNLTAGPRVKVVDLNTNPNALVKVGDTVIIDGRRITLIDGMGLGSNGDQVVRITGNSQEINLAENRFLYQEAFTTGHPNGKWIPTENILLNNKSGLINVETKITGSIFERTPSTFNKPYSIAFIPILIGGITVNEFDRYLDSQGYAGIYEFIIDLFTPDPESDSPISKYGKSIVERAREIINSITPPIPAEIYKEVEDKDAKSDFETRLENLDIFNQKLQDFGEPINPAGESLTVRGCGPSTTINVLRLLGFDPNPYEIIDNYIWGEGSSTNADAVLTMLQQYGGIDGAYEYGTSATNRITNATELNDYTGILVYGGTVNDGKPDEAAHISTIDCKSGECYAIDSYFNDGKLTKCEVKSSNNLTCGNAEYHVGQGGGSPDALFPVRGH